MTRGRAVPARAHDGPTRGGAPGPSRGPLAGRALSKRALAALERKYTALLDLRRRRDRGGNTERAQLAALAQAFPGCLRELDRNRAVGLARRLSAIRAARAGTGPVRPWMHWIWRYHRLLSVTLAARRAHTAPSHDAQARRRHAPRPVNPAAAGRPSRIVLAAVSADFGTTPERVARTLFPPRRPPPAPGSTVEPPSRG